MIPYARRFLVLSRANRVKMSHFFKKLARIVRQPWQDKINLFHTAAARLKTELYYRHIFGSMGRGCLIYKPLLFHNPQFVHIGNYTMIRPGARIEAIVFDESRPPSLVIGSNVNIEQNVHLICSSRLVIGNDVTITGNCAIVDTKHPYDDVSDARKIGDRIDPSSFPVQIGENCFLGYGCVVLPGTSIGKHCIVGANSVVTRDVPDYSVIAGNPAAVVKRYDCQKQDWVR